MVSEVLVYSLLRGILTSCRKNVTIQPGPLSLDASERSHNTPSFRIVDFGRAAMHFEVFGEMLSGMLKSEAFTDGRFVQCLGESVFKKFVKRDLTEVFSRSYGILDCLDRECFCCIHEQKELPTCTSEYRYHLEMA